MSQFLDAAYRVLEEAGKPLSPAELVELAQTKGWLISSGKTPSQTMKSKLSTDILARKDRSRFMRTDKGKFGLRLWKREQVQEYHAQRFQKALLDEDVVVFPASSLEKYVPGPGLHPTSEGSGRDLVRECYSMCRRAAEEDFSVVQLVSVFIVRLRDRYLTYKRTKRLPEQRLHGYYSIAFGGHLNQDDVPTLFDIFGPQCGEFLFRELEEEIKFPNTARPSITYKGLLYDNARDVSRQHLGISYDVVLKVPQYEIGERGFLMDPKFESLDEIEARVDEFENWSGIILQHERGSRERRNRA